MICFMDEYSGFETLSFAEKFIEVKQIVDDYITKAKRQRDDWVKLLRMEIKDEFMKDIHELISPSLEVVSTLSVFSSISQTSRVRVVERWTWCIWKYCFLIDFGIMQRLSPLTSWTIHQTQVNWKLLLRFGWDTKNVWGIYVSGVVRFILMSVIRINMTST